MRCEGRLTFRVEGVHRDGDGGELGEPAIQQRLHSRGQRVQAVVEVVKCSTVRARGGGGWG